MPLRCAWRADPRRERKVGRGEFPGVRAKCIAMIGDRIGWNRPLPLTRTVLRVRVHTPESAAAFQRSCEVARDWLEGLAERRGLIRGAAPPAHAGPSLVLREVRSGAAAALLAEYRHGDERNAHRSWHGQLRLAPHREHGGDIAVLDLSLRLSYRSDDSLDLFPPALFRDLLERVGLADVRPLSATPMTFGARDIPALVALVGDRARRHPVLLVSEPCTIDIDEMAQKLAGIAHVVRIEDEVGWSLTHRFGRNASAFAGFARLFPSGASFDDPSKSVGVNPQRPLALSSTANESPATIFARRLRTAVLDANTYRFETGPLLHWDEFRADEIAPSAATPVAPVGAAAPLVSEQTDRERIGQLESELDDLRKELAAARQRATEAESAWEDAVGESDALKRERDASLHLPLAEFTEEEGDRLRESFRATALLAEQFRVQGELRAEAEEATTLAEMLRARLYDERTVRPATAGIDAGEPLPVDWRDFAALDRWRAETFGERLLFHPRVEQRLGDGRLSDENARALFAMLRALGGPFVEMCRSVPGARDRWRLQTQAYIVRPAITATGLGRVSASQYDCVYEDETIPGDRQWHIRQRGVDFEGRHACIYYVWFEPRQAVLVTSMPRHLDTANAYT